MRRIRWHVIFSDIMSCFIMACASVLLINFFGYETIMEIGGLEVENIKLEVGGIFLIILLLRVGFELIRGGERWLTSRHDVFCTLEEAVIRTPSREDMEEIKQINEFNKKITVVHEAGHAVMAYLLGIYFEVILSETHPRVECAYKQTSIEVIKNIILVKYSGAIAEELLLGSFHIGCLLGDDSDFVTAKTLIRAYVAMKYSSVSEVVTDMESEKISELIKHYSEEFYGMAKSILVEKQDMIRIVADELTRKNYLSKSDVSRLHENLIYQNAKKRADIKTLIETSGTIQEADEVIEKYTCCTNIAQKIAYLQGMFDCEIVQRNVEDEEADYIALLASIINV